MFGEKLGLGAATGIPFPIVFLSLSAAV